MTRALQYGLVLTACVAGVSAALFSQGPPAPATGQQPPNLDLNAYYQLGPDSLPHDGIPKGEVRGPFVLPSQAYPGTQHT